MRTVRRLLEFESELCSIFGLEARKTKRIVLTVEAGSLVTLDVTQFVYDDEAREITEAIRHFELEAVEVEIVDPTLDESVKQIEPAIPGQLTIDNEEVVETVSGS